jgi:hypothetical protein
LTQREQIKKKTVNFLSTFKKFVLLPTAKLDEIYFTDKNPEAELQQQNKKAKIAGKASVDFARH